MKFKTDFSFNLVSSIVADIVYDIKNSKIIVPGKLEESRPKEDSEEDPISSNVPAIVEEAEQV